MEQSYLRSFEARCTQEEPPACQTMCPLHVEARSFCDLMARGRYREARALLDRAMPLSGLTGYLCSGECMAHCRRAEVDSGVNVPLLERACLGLTSAARPMPMPGTGKRIAVAGSGLSSLCFACEIAKKGHTVTVFHRGEAGGALQRLCASGRGGALPGAASAHTALPRNALPETALPEALDLLRALKVGFEKVDDFGPQWLEGTLAAHAALYVGLDDDGMLAGAPALGGCTNPLTLESADPKVFVGGHSRAGGEASFILDAAEGKRAAGSVIRLLQGVAPATAREADGVYPTKLYTDVSGAQSVPAVRPENPCSPTADEAKAEAARCLQCECLECVKRCAWLARYKGYPKRYAREMYNNLSVVHGLRRANTQINSCSLCGLCGEVCPQNADMGLFCVSARAEMVTSKRMPPSAHEFALEDMAFSNAPEVAFFRHAPGLSTSSHALFPGCQLPASMPEQTARLYAHLREHMPAGQSLGLFFHCCGAPAEWSGRAQLTEATVSSIRSVWDAAGRPGLIVACASCAAFFARFLPEVPVRFVWEYLAEAPLPKEAAAASLPLALHDPCPSRHEPEQRGAVRQILTALGQSVEELPLGRELTRCCGYGGLADAADPGMGAAMAKDRLADTSSDILAYCSMCRDRLAAQGGAVLHLLDLLFPQQPPAQAARRPAPGISTRQERRAAFRKNLLATLWNEPTEPETMDSPILHIDAGLAARLEARRILRSDIMAVLAHAEEHGAQFYNPSTGRSLTSLRPKQVTFWVEYATNEDGSVTVHDAYCHRMVAPGTPGAGADTAVTLEGYAPKGGRM